MQQGIPFEMKIPRNKPLAYESLTKEQFDIEIEKGIKSINESKIYPADEVEKELFKEFGL